MNKKKFNYWYFLRASLFFQIVYIYFASAFLVSKLPLYAVILIDIFIIYLTSCFLVKSISFFNEFIEINYPLRIFKVKIIIHYSQIKLIRFKNGSGSGDMSEFWIYYNKFTPIVFTYSAEINEIEYLLKELKNKGVNIKINSRNIINA